MISLRQLAIEMTVLAAVAGLFTLLGPFGSYALPIGDRLVDWLLFTFGGYLFFRPVIAAGDALALQSGLTPWITITFACLLAALPTTLGVAWILAGRSWQQVTFVGLVDLYPQVLIVGATVTAIQLLLRLRQDIDEEALVEAINPDEAGLPDRSAEHSVEHADVAKAAMPLQPAFLDLLPAHLGSNLICLENEDHYIRVHTSAGSALILMRMRDAVAQLEAEDGERVHRGWWVAKRAVVEVVRRDRAMALRLANGLEAPVARVMVPVLRAKLWI